MGPAAGVGVDRVEQEFEIATMSASRRSTALAITCPLAISSRRYTIAASSMRTTRGSSASAPPRAAHSPPPFRAPPVSGAPSVCQRLSELSLFQPPYLQRLL